MKIHKIELLVLDFDDIGIDGVVDIIENQRYPNHCISPDVMFSESRDVGEGSDDHPLNKFHTRLKEYSRLFMGSNAEPDK